MFIQIQKVDIAQIPATHLGNPKSPGIPMVLALYRTEGRAAFFKSINKRVLYEYLETPSGKRIPNRKWTGEMRAFAQEQLKQLPPQRTVFKVTVVGWIFLLLCCVALGLIFFNGPGGGKQIIFNNLGGQVQPGDVYFGRFQETTSEGLPVRDGYAWFRVNGTKGDTVMIALGKETTEDYNVPEDELSSLAFSDSVYKTTIREQKDYTIDFRTNNSEMMFMARKRKSPSDK